MFDPIELLSTVYGQIDTRESWLRGVFDQLKALPGTVGFVGYSVPRGLGVPEQFVGQDVDLESAARAIINGAKRPERQQAVAAIEPLGLFSSVELFGDCELLLGAPDAYALAYPDAERRFHVIVGYADRRVVNDEPTLWRHIALHLGAGARLLRQNGALSDGEVEAVFDASGGVVHLASDEAEANREQLRSAVRNVDTLRCRKGSADLRSAVALWPGLILGRWSLVEHFDSDGRRFVVARRNDPDSPRRGQLTRRERQVAFYAGLGLSNKYIGYALGIGASTVAHHLKNVMKKLDVKSHAELIELAARLGPDAK